MLSEVRSNFFVLEAFDRDLWCPVAQTRFHVADVEALRAIVSGEAGNDPELHYIYHLDDDELDEVVARFGVRFDRSEFKSADIDFHLMRWHPSDTPYLIHTNYELPLLLDGRKKLARMSHDYPPMTFEGEHRFDHWVAEGMLHREVVVEPFEAPVKGFLGTRTVYYTPKGEEWRIPANKLIWKVGAGAWNEHFERLEGMILGYEDWQNDWWIDHLQRRGTFGGLPFCCPVTLAGLAWMQAAGFRALPPVEGRALVVASCDPDAKDELHGLLLENPDCVAVVSFNIDAREAKDFINFKNSGPWQIGAERIGELNSKLRSPVAVVIRRDVVV